MEYFIVGIAFILISQKVHKEVPRIRKMYNIYRSLKQTVFQSTVSTCRFLFEYTFQGCCPKTAKCNPINDQSWKLVYYIHNIEYILHVKPILGPHKPRKRGELSIISESEFSIS